MKMLRIIRLLVAAGVLVCQAAAQPVISAVLNGASYSAVIAPGSLISIFGSNLAPAAQSAGSVPLPMSLGGVSVSVGSLPASVLYVSPTQINALIPLEVAIPPNTVVPLVLNSPAGNSSYNLRLTRNAPGIFTRNGAGTGRALVFDANFKAVETIGAQDTLILYATGLGPTDASGQVIDPVEVYIGERLAQVQFAGLAPELPGVYQVNVAAPAPASDRLFIRAGGWQSNITEVGIRSGANVTNVEGSIDGLYPSSDPFFNLPPCPGDDSATFPCNAGESLSIMLHAGSFRVSFDIVPSASPFAVAAVGVAGGSVISIDPMAGTYTASITTITPEAAMGNFSKSVIPLWDYVGCNPKTAVCPSFPGPGVLPRDRLDSFWVQATRLLPIPSATSPTSPNGVVQVSGKLDGSRLVIDDQNNTALSKFGGIVPVPFGPFETDVSTFKLYVDGKLVASKDLPYRVIHR